LYAIFDLMVVDSGTERASDDVTFDFMMGAGWLAALMRMVVYEGRIWGGGVEGDGVGEAVVVAAKALMARKRVVDFIVKEWCGGLKPCLRLPLMVCSLL
jgi:hypothetical protein